MSCLALSLMQRCKNNYVNVRQLPATVRHAYLLLHDKLLMPGL